MKHGSRDDAGDGERAGADTPCNASSRAVNLGAKPLPRPAKKRNAHITTGIAYTGCPRNSTKRWIEAISTKRKAKPIARKYRAIRHRARAAAGACGLLRPSHRRGVRI